MILLFYDNPCNLLGYLYFLIFIKYEARSSQILHIVSWIVKLPCDTVVNIILNSLIQLSHLVNLFIFTNKNITDQILILSLSLYKTEFLAYVALFLDIKLLNLAGYVLMINSLDFYFLEKSNLFHL